MMKNIINAIIAQYDEYTVKAADRIRTSEEAMKRESTETRYQQYLDNKITLEQCQKYAIDRKTKHYEKEKAHQISRTEAIDAAPTLKELTISIVWKKSSIWGYNPHAEVTAVTEKGIFCATGSASGCGYDKRSAAVAEAMNKIDSCLKVIYTLRENNTKPYGSGTHNAYPYFEGGVGIDCFHNIMNLANFEKISDHGTKTTDFYHYVRK